MSWLIDKNVWLEIYSSIKRELALSFDLDQLATDLLSNILSTMSNTIDIKQLKKGINSDCVLVFGPAPSIENDFQKANELSLFNKLPVIAVNGAATFFYEKGFVPTIIVTDLDGDPNHIASLNDKGAIVVVHAHGDNIDEIKKWVPKFSGHLIGSTQVEPRPHVYNFGGFTDGDRALFIVYALGIRKAIVGGMNFLNNIGKYSTMYKKKNEGIKRLKMSIAMRLIKMLTLWGMEIKALSDTGIPNIEVI